MEETIRSVPKEDLGEQAGAEKEAVLAETEGGRFRTRANPQNDGSI